jgi:glycosyltransferase involved in cell wall biosynthesis
VQTEFPKVVVVHRGSRDGYQVARGLEDVGLLQTLVTDIYWPGDKAWARSVEKLAPRKLQSALRRRYADGLPSQKVERLWSSGVSSMAISKSGWLPFEMKRDAVRRCDRSLGRRAGEIANRTGAALLSYSYYGHSAFSIYEGPLPRILFQLHPHPASVRKILRRESMLHPDCASSLEKEWELALTEEDFGRLVEESAMAERWIVASRFSKQTLIDAGIPGERVEVVPYGIDLKRFSPRDSYRKVVKPLRLLFVGTICQRKGIKYLKEALALLPPGSVELTICGRPVDDLAMFRDSGLPVRLFPSISAQGLLDAYQSADVFVFPSLAEGFAQVLLEALASGLPIISTTRTAAPDLIRHGEQGYIIEPGDPVALATQIEKFLEDPTLVRSMGEAARTRAEYFTWERFRAGVAASVENILLESAQSPAGKACLQS